MGGNLREYYLYNIECHLESYYPVYMYTLQSFYNKVTVALMCRVQEIHA